MEVFIYVTKDDYKILKMNAKLMESCKIYLQGYINALENKVNEIQKHLIKEKQILEYLKQNETLRHKLKVLLDKELSYFNKHYPQIVESWNYYKEFKDICNTDSINA